MLHDASHHLDFNRVMKIMIETCRGLIAMHTSDPPMLHRDLKSPNILLDGEWDVKIADFGLTGLHPGHTVQMTDMASPYWTAPEVLMMTRFQHPCLFLLFWHSTWIPSPPPPLPQQVLERREYSEASDVYSLGVVIWETFVRKAPFADMSPYQVP